MADIWIDERHARLKKYNATVTGPKATVTIVIEVAEPGALGYLLKELGEIDLAQQRSALKPKPATKKEPLALPAPAKQLPFYDRGDEA